MCVCVYISRLRDENMKNGTAKDLMDLRTAKSNLNLT